MLYVPIVLGEPIFIHPAMSFFRIPYPQSLSLSHVVASPPLWQGTIFVLLLSGS